MHQGRSKLGQPYFEFSVRKVCSVWGGPLINNTRKFEEIAKDLEEIRYICRINLVWEKMCKGYDL